jgi:hypothetical protein
MFNTIFTNNGPAIRYCEVCKDLYINYTIVPSSFDSGLPLMNFREQNEKRQRDFEIELHKPLMSVEESQRFLKESLKPQLPLIKRSCLEPIKIDNSKWKV